MGQGQSRAKKALMEPLEEKVIRTAVRNMDEGAVQRILNVLLDGTMPTNFSFQDIVQDLDRHTDREFIMLPIWTLMLSNVDASAKCMVKHWPIFTQEEMDSPAFLSSCRVMLPLFKPGTPIGHARFMFLDQWRPLPASTLQDEDVHSVVECHHYLPTGARSSLHCHGL